jgi:bacterioferritin (cytochrome b1)
MLNSFYNDDSTDLTEVIDTPKETEDIVSVCDRLLTSLKNTEEDAVLMLQQLKKMKKKFS